MYDISELKTHTEIFHVGKNFKTLITAKNIKDFGLKLQWNPKERWVEFTYQGIVKHIPEGNVASWDPEQQTKAPIIINEHKTESVEGRRKAQVSTPTGHVFDGEGKGKVKQ